VLERMKKVAKRKYQELWERNKVIDWKKHAEKTSNRGGPRKGGPGGDEGRVFPQKRGGGNRNKKTHLCTKRGKMNIEKACGKRFSKKEKENPLGVRINCGLQPEKTGSGSRNPWCG